MKNKSQYKFTSARRFWEAFKACVEGNRVKPERLLFYIKWVQAFVDFLPGKRLRKRSCEDIEAFFAQLSKCPGIENWQVRQAEHALKILYETFLPGHAPEAAAQPVAETEKKKGDALQPEI